MKNKLTNFEFKRVVSLVGFKAPRLYTDEKRGRLKGAHLILLMFIASFLISCNDDDRVEPWQPEIELLRSAIVAYDLVEHAKHDGYDNEVTGYRTNMGFHYLNASLLDDKFEVEKPELLLYAPDENGKLKFVAVEYAMPITDLDNPPPIPQGFKGDADVWEINTEFSLWTLHVWVKLENPEGIFASHNPLLH